MKKTLLSLLVVLTSISVSAQKFVSKTFVGSLDRQTVVSGAKKAPAKVDLPSNQRLIGYYTTDDCDNSLGLTGLPGNYKAGILLENTDFSAYVGAKVVGVRYSLGQSSTASGVYVSKVNAGQITEAATKTESNSVTGWHTTMFDTADQFDLTDDIEGLMVGFSYKQTSSNYPIGFFTNGPKRNFYVYGNIPASAGGSGEAWYNMGDSYGSPAIQLIVEGTFPENAVVPSPFGKFTTALNGSKDVKVTLLNAGSSLSSFDYTLTQEGTTSAEKHAVLDSPLGVGGSVVAKINIPAASVVGSHEVVLTITKVNGAANEASSKSASGTNITLSRALNKASVVEEFTGTTCGWCPRGHVGMKNLREQFGDQFIGIAIHQYDPKDPMYNANYAALGFSGAPSCMINRDGSAVDPYYGSSTSIANDFSASLEDLPELGVTVTGQWSEDSTQVLATANVEALVSGNYNIDFVLVGDSLGSTGSAWKQTNYYSSAYASSTGLSKSQLPDDLKFLWTAGSSWVTTFNDVLLASSYVSTNNKATLDPLTADQTTTSNYTLTFPTKAALVKGIKKQYVYVVAIVSDPTTGAIINAAKAPLLPCPSGIQNVNNENSASVEVARYTLNGQRISAPVKGVNIVKYANGKTVKEIVK